MDVTDKNWGTFLLLPTWESSFFDRELDWTQIYIFYMHCDVTGGCHWGYSKANGLTYSTRAWTSNKSSLDGLLSQAGPIQLWLRILVPPSLCSALQRGGGDKSSISDICLLWLWIINLNILKHKRQKKNTVYFVWFFFWFF